MPGEHEPVRIGLLHSLSGPMASFERHLLDSELLAIDEINASGGVLGRPVEPVVADGASVPHIFANKTEDLLARGIDTFFGCWSSATRQAVRHVIEIQGGLLWYPLPYEGLEESEKIIYTGPCPNQQILPAVDWIVAHGGGRLFFLGSDSIYARSVDKLIRSHIKLTGINCIIAGAEYLHGNTDDFSTILQEIRHKKPDFIFNVMASDTNLPFLKHYYKAGVALGHIPMMVVGSSEVELQAVAPQTTDLFACSSYFQSLPLAANASFVSRFKKRYGPQRVVSAPIITAYAQLELWKQAVQAASSFSAKNVAQSAQGCSYNGPIKVTISINHHVSLYAHVGRLKADGQFNILWQSPDEIAPLPWAGVGEREVIGQRYVQGETLYLRPHRSGRFPEPDKNGTKAPVEDFRSDNGVLKQIFDGTPAATLLTDLSGIVLLANRAAEKLLGFSEIELKGKAFAAFTTAAFTAQDSFQIGDNMLNRLFASGIEYKGESEFIAKDGRKVILDVAVSTIQNTEGDREYLVVTISDVSVRKVLKNSEATLKAILSASPVGMILTMPDGRIQWMNDRVVAITGYTVEELLYLHTRVLYWGEEESNRVNRELFEGVEKDGIATVDTQWISKSGAVQDVRLSVSTSSEDVLSAVVLIVEEITQKKRIEQELAESEERYRVVVENSNDGVCLSKGSTIVYANHKVVEMFDFGSQDELIGLSMDHLAQLDARDIILTRIQEFERVEDPALRFEFRGITKNGVPLDVELNFARVVFRGDNHLLTYIRDVTVKKVAEAELQRYYKFLEDLSNTDGLTGIANRRRFDDALNQEWRRARRLNSPLSLLFIDIDFFKAYNDNYGHLAGDDCLRQVASALVEVMRRPADTVARYGGEEFVCVLPDTDSRGARWIARQIHKKLRTKSIPHGYSSVSDRITASIGLASMVPPQDGEPTELIRRADESLYHAKQTGRNRTESSPDTISA